MFVRMFLVLLSVAALTRAAAVQGNGQLTETDCEKYSLPSCTREYDPVCGSDGKTYGNECMLCLAKLEGQSNIYIVNLGEC